MTTKRWIPVAVLLLALVAVALSVRSCYSTLPFAGPRRERVDHAIVLERVRNVAQLATSETSLRDVLTYQNTWMGSTKRSIVVVTGTVLAGVDLDSAKVAVEEKTHRIVVTLPPPRILSVAVRDLRTYDERSGLWNRFTSEDRDRVYQLARERLEQAAGELDLLPHANQNARAVLSKLLVTEGWEIVIEGDAPAFTLPRD